MPEILIWMSKTPNQTRQASTKSGRRWRVREEDFHGVPIDEVVVRLLDEHAGQPLRARMRADAEHARANAEDLAEVRRVQAEMDEVSAW